MSNPTTGNPTISNPETSKEIFKYDKGLLEVIKQRHDTLLSLAIQNYTACGAIAFFFFNSSNQLPFWLAAVFVFLLNINCSYGIAANCFIAKKMYAMHRIVIRCWLEGNTRPELKAALEADPDSKAILASNEFPGGVDFSHPAVFANLIPTIGLVLVILARAFKLF
jgi:hypothetical protein